MRCGACQYDDQTLYPEKVQPEPFKPVVIAFADDRVLTQPPRDSVQYARCVATANLVSCPKCGTVRVTES